MSEFGPSEIPEEAENNQEASEQRKAEVREALDVLARYINGEPGAAKTAHQLLAEVSPEHARGAREKAEREAAYQKWEQERAEAVRQHQESTQNEPENLQQ